MPPGGAGLHAPGGADTSADACRSARAAQRQTQLLPYLWLSHLRWTAAATNNVRGLQGMPLPGGGQSAGLVGGVMQVTGMWIDQ